MDGIITHVSKMYSKETWLQFMRKIKSGISKNYSSSGQKPS